MVRWLEACSCWISIFGKAILLLVSLLGGVEHKWCTAAPRIRQNWSRDTNGKATISAAVDCQPTQMALRWPISSPAKVSGDSSTSRWRPSVEHMAEFIVLSESSGQVPDAVEDDRSLCSWCCGGDRGPDRVFSIKFRVLLVISRGCDFLFSQDPYCNCTCTADD
jgi:hypothetical protein